MEYTSALPYLHLRDVLHTFFQDPPTETQSFFFDVIKEGINWIVFLLRNRIVTCWSWQPAHSIVISQRDLLTYWFAVRYVITRYSSSTTPPSSVNFMISIKSGCKICSFGSLVELDLPANAKYNCHKGIFSLKAWITQSCQGHWLR